MSNAVQNASESSVTVVDPPEAGWHSWYVNASLAIDVTAGIVAAAIAVVVRFGPEPREAYLVASALFPLLWVAALVSQRLYSPRFLGAGVEEFRRVFHAGVGLAALVAIAAYATKTGLARGYVALVMPLAILMTLAGRRILRMRLHRLRSLGRGMQRVVALGHPADVIGLVDHLSRETYHGLKVVGTCLSSRGQVDVLFNRGIPVISGFDNIERAVELCRADTVAVVSSPEMSGEDLRRLSWRLERRRTALIVSPGLVEVGGPRLTIRPAAGLSLLHVEHPTLSGSRFVVKSLLDRGLALLGLIALSPLLVCIAVAVRCTDPGPAFYRQRRVGVHGRAFNMIKFRTMVADAERRRAELLTLNENDGVLFKIRRDPRVTPFGRVLRRYSLDELPQLINVLLGHMSLVGPRPPLPDEVTGYTEHAHRRLLVKPGLTGLWQVSGRSDLSWEESLRLDLRYVDNWSLTLDLLVMWKTWRAVLTGAGAY